MSFLQMGPCLWRATSRHIKEVDWETDGSVCYQIIDTDLEVFPDDVICAWTTFTQKNKCNLMKLSCNVTSGQERLDNAGVLQHGTPVRWGSPDDGRGMWLAVLFISCCSTGVIRVGFHFDGLKGAFVHTSRRVCSHNSFHKYEVIARSNNTA
jgi:hypothetical protein